MKLSPEASGISLFSAKEQSPSRVHVFLPSVLERSVLVVITI